jgi:hypothetical protein
MASRGIVPRNRLSDGLREGRETRKGLPNFSIVESDRTIHTLIDVKPDNI